MVSFNSSCPIPDGALDYGDKGTSWRPMVYASFACTLATSATAFSLIVLHLLRYRAPKEQRQIIRICFSVILYAIVAFFEVYDYRIAQYIDPIGDLYEAFGLAALFLLFIQYAAPDGRYDSEHFSAVKEAEEVQSRHDWPRIAWIFVFQYPMVETVCFLIIVLSELTGRYCANSLEPQFAHLWAEILQSLGICACVIAILAFRNRMKGLMKCRRALAKIICFKIIVGIRFSQAWAFSMLLQYNVVKTSNAFSYNDILWGIPGLATCAEMVLFAAGFWYAFSSTEYGASAKPGRPLPAWRALLDALNPWDLILGICRVFPLIFEVHRSGDWKKWRVAGREQAVDGFRNVGKAVGHLKKHRRKSDGSGRYLELGASMDDLQKPTQAYQAGSNWPLGDETSNYSTPDLGQGELHSISTSTAVVENVNYPALKEFDGRDRELSGQWVGQNFYRTPSPAASVSNEAHGREGV